MLWMDRLRRIGQSDAIITACGSVCYVIGNRYGQAIERVLPGETRVLMEASSPRLKW